MSRYKKQDSAVNTVAPETIDEVSRYPIMPVPERGLTLETCKHWGLRTAVSTTDGQTPIAHYLPVYTKGKLTGYLKRRLDVPKKRAWSVVGCVDINCDLIGSHCTGNSNRKLFVVEGFYDAPSAWQSLMQEQKIPGQYAPTVVSIPLGIGQDGDNAGQSILNNAKFIEKYGEIIFCYDNDELEQEFN